MALEAPPCYSDAELSAYSELLHENTLPSPSPTMTSLDPSTAAMLKDVTFLLDTVLALPQTPSPWDLQKVQSMSNWLQGRLSGAAASTSNTTPTNNDNSGIHQVVQLASLLYCRAIRTRTPFSRTTGQRQKEHEGLADTVCAVPLELWDGDVSMLGTLILALAVLMPTATTGAGTEPDVRQGCRVRVRMVAAAVQLALVDFKAVVEALGRVVRLQAWLRGGD